MLSFKGRISGQRRKTEVAFETPTWGSWPLVTIIRIIIIITSY